MSFFDAFYSYNFFLNALTSFLFFLSFYAVGYFLKSRFYSFVFGVLFVSLLAQLLSFFDVSNFEMLARYMGYGLLFLGLYGLHLLRANFKEIYNEITNNKYLLLLVVVMLLGFLISIAPLSKHDEVFYHALLPSRILSDGYLHFYMWPFEAAMLPQMFFQMAMVPLFAIGYPNSSNAVGFLFSILIAIYIYNPNC